MFQLKHFQVMTRRDTTAMVGFLPGRSLGCARDDARKDIAVAGIVFGGAVNAV
jgi:hypothetical protein